MENNRNFNEDDRCNARTPIRRMYVQTPHLLGTQYQELDIPRDTTHPTADFEHSIIRQIVIPSRWFDILADGLIWLGWITGIVSALNQLNLLFHSFVLTVIAVAIAFLLFISIYWLRNVRDSRVQGSLLYRWFLILLGGFLGVMSS